MAKITVTSLNDDGSGGRTLREAIEQARAAPGKDTIIFAPKLKDKTIILQDRLVIDDPNGVTIRGDMELDGEIDITISGDIDEDGRFNSTLAGGMDDARRIDSTDSDFLLVKRDSKVSIRGVEFDHGYAGGPADSAVNKGTVAAIVNRGDLTIAHSRIDGIKVVAGGSASRDAAVIANRGSGKLGIHDVVFDDAYVQAGRAPGTNESGISGGHAALIHNTGDLEISRFTTSGRFYGGHGAAVSDVSGFEVTDGGDGSAWIINEGRIQSDTIVAVRTGASLAVSGGARGRIVDVTPPFDPVIYGNYGTANSIDIVTNKNGGVFNGAELRGIFADQGPSSSDYSAGPPSSSVATPSGGVAWLGLGGRDTVIGSPKGDYLYGGRGGDIITSGRGGDIVGGGTGADSIRAGGGADTIRGSFGDDTIKAGNGKDNVLGGRDDDMVLGGANNDTLDGQAGRDTLIGDGGQDKLFGSDGHDRLEGNQGDDRLIGGAGNDTLKGDGGSDRYIFRKNEGSDVVVDFRDGVDKLVILSGASTFFDLTIKDQPGGAVIEFSGTSIKLKGIDASDVDPGDFIF